MNASLKFGLLLAALSFLAQPASAENSAGVAVQAGSTFNSEPETLTSGFYQGVQQSLSVSGTAGADGNPYTASASGAGLFRNGAIRVSSTTNVTGAVTASVYARSLLDDGLFFETGRAEALVVNYSFAVDRKVAGAYKKTADYIRALGRTKRRSTRQFELLPPSCTRRASGNDLFRSVPGSRSRSTTNLRCRCPQSCFLQTLHVKG